MLKSGVEEIDRRLAAVALPNLSPGVVAKPPKKAADLPPASIYWEDGADRRHASQLESRRRADRRALCRADVRA